MRTHLKVWLKLFIPGHMPGFTQRVESGPHAGKTAVPVVPNLRFGNFTKLFLTDQRDFSSAPDASARLTIKFEVNIDEFSRPGISSFEHYSHPTISVNPETGEAESKTETPSVQVNPIANPSPMRTSGSAIPPRFSMNLHTREYGAAPKATVTVMPPAVFGVRIQAAAGNPFGFGLFSAPKADLDIALLFIVGSREIEVQVDGTHDGFPAYEIYMQNGAETIALYRYTPTKKNVRALFPPLDQYASQVQRIQR